MITKDFTYEPESRTAYCCAEKLMGTRLEILLTDIEKRAAELLCDFLIDSVASADSLLNRFDHSSEVSRLNSAIIAAAKSPDLTPIAPVSPKSAAKLPDLTPIAPVSPESAAKSPDLTPIAPVSPRSAAKSPDLTPMSPELSAWGCLAETYRAKTGGAFDVRYAGEYDFGGLAKGAMLSRAAQALRDRGVHDALLNFGGSSILGLGHHPFGDAWKVDVPDPFSGRTLVTVKLRDSAMSVSGNTPGYGGHIVDTQTGERVLASRVVVVTAPDPTDAEVLSTSIMANPTRRETLLAAFPGASAQIFDNL